MRTECDKGSHRRPPSCPGSCNLLQSVALNMSNMVGIGPIHHDSSDYRPPWEVRNACWDGCRARFWLCATVVWSGASLERIHFRPEWRVMPGREWKTIQDDGVLKQCWSIREMYSEELPRSIFGALKVSH